jgi:N-acetylmuramoyl-L-alanine amidase
MQARLFGRAINGLALFWLVPAWAQPLPVPNPKSDPIGALIQSQGLDKKRETLPIVIGLKLEERAARSRFVIELSDPIEAQIFTLSGPNRVVIDLPALLWRAPADARPSGTGAVKSYRYGLFRKGSSRFVVDLNAPVKAEAPRLLPPEGGSGFRLVIDLMPATPAEFLAHSGWPKDLQETEATVQGRASSGPGNNGRHVIVIDAGHGGVDPGTHGQSGVQEKDLVLAVAKELRRVLEATHRYRVLLTRDTDIFIPLRERVNIARAAHGDLFVSLHADSNDHREIRGASVYTLSEAASDREAATLAEKENMSDVIAGVDLTGENNPVASILIDLAQRDTMNRSLRFAETVIAGLPAVTSVQPVKPHRAAGFAVLKAPDIPSALIELGYLTNAKDESDMITQAWRGRVARSIAEAIETHFGDRAAAGNRQASAP